MDMIAEKKAAPLKPYDDSMWNHWTLYDSMPYVQDKDTCNESNITKESGNIIKSYRCLVKEPYELNTN